MPANILDDIELMYKNLMKMKVLADEEGVARARVEFSPEYINLTKQISAAQERQAEMMEGLKEKEEEYTEYRKKFLIALIDSGKLGYKEWRPKLKKVKRVNNKILFNKLEGDIDLFLSIANVTQVALKAHAKDNKDEKSLLESIEEFEQMVDVEFDPAAK